MEVNENFINGINDTLDDLYNIYSIMNDTLNEMINASELYIGNLSTYADKLYNCYYEFDDLYKTLIQEFQYENIDTAKVENIYNSNIDNFENALKEFDNQANIDIIDFKGYVDTLQVEHKYNVKVKYPKKGEVEIIGKLDDLLDIIEFNHLNKYENFEGEEIEYVEA